MSGTTTDRERLHEAFRVYEQAFAQHVGDVLTPYGYLDEERQVDWAARVFMFAYGLGAVAATDTETDRERVERLVDDVVGIHESDALDVSTERVKRDFLDG